MDAAIINVGDELLSGDIENTNATWLAERLTGRGVSTRRVVVLPDDLDVIAGHVREYADAFDAVIVTGGLGDTPDDVTMEAVAEAFGTDLVVDDLAMADLEETIAAIREDYPDFSVNMEREASIPDGGRPLINDDGLSPGCVVENVYVMPGIPREMKPMFESVADEFAGDVRSRAFFTETAEADLVPVLEEFRDAFDSVTMGCYPNRGEGHNQLKITGEDEGALDEAEAWVREHVAVSGDA